MAILSKIEIIEMCDKFKKLSDKFPEKSDNEICKFLMRYYNITTPQGIKFHLRKQGLTGKQVKKTTKKTKSRPICINEMGNRKYHRIKLKENQNLSKIVHLWVGLRKKQNAA